MLVRRLMHPKRSHLRLHLCIPLLHSVSRKDVSIYKVRMLRPTARGLGTCLLYTPQVLLLGHLFITYGYNASPAYGVSMTPTIDFSGEVLIVSKQYRRGRGIQVGDLVSFRHPVLTDFGERAVKRVIGMPGDFVLRDTPGHGIFGEEAMIQVGSNKDTWPERGKLWC